MLQKAVQLLKSAPFNPEFRGIFRKASNISQVRNVMILNELRRVRVSGIEPVAHVVSNLLIY